MDRLPCIGKCGSRHRDLHQGKHVIELPHPLHPVLPLRHGKMQGDSKEHLLWCLKRFMPVRMDDIALQEKIETGVCEKSLSLESSIKAEAVSSSSVE